MIRSARSSTMSMSCSMTMTVSDARNGGDQRVHARGLFRAHAGGRLVEQQHLRLAGERQRDFELALAAVAEVAHRGAEHVGEADLRRDLVGLRVHRGAACRIGRQNTARRSRPQRAGERKIVAHREIRETGCCAGTSARCRCARGWSRRGAVTSRPANRMVPAVRPQIAGEQVEIGGLAGAVRADDGVAQARPRRRG